MLLVRVKLKLNYDGCHDFARLKTIVNIINGKNLFSFPFFTRKCHITI